MAISKCYRNFVIVLSEMSYFSDARAIYLYIFSVTQYNSNVYLIKSMNIIVLYYNIRVLRFILKYYSALIWFIYSIYNVHYYWFKYISIFSVKNLASYIVELFKKGNLILKSQINLKKMVVI